MDVMLWMGRSGARRRDLHERFGDCRTVKRRYYDWVARGVFMSLFKALSEDGDFEWVCVRHHHPGPSTRRRRLEQKRWPDAQGLRRSKGGLTTKLHVATDALGNPARLMASPGPPWRGDLRCRAD